MNTITRDKVSWFKIDLPGKDYFPSVPDGTYEANFIGAESFMFFEHPKVCLWFRLNDNHLDQCNVVARYFNVNEIVGSLPKIGRRTNPQFTVGARSALAREIGWLFPGKYSPFRLPTRIPKEIANRLVLVEVKKSKHDRNRIELVPEFRESRITRILGWADKK